MTSPKITGDILVTDEMAAAGFKAYYAKRCGYSVEAFKDAYRAMRKLEPKQEGPTGTGPERPKPREAQHFHRRYSDSIYGPPTRYETHAHQRSTDT